MNAGENGPRPHDRAADRIRTGVRCQASPAATPTERTALRVHSFAVNEWLLWTKPDSTWVWKLVPTAQGGTRLITRIHAVYDWKQPMMALLGLLLMEFGDFPMLRRMLRGIRQRAEPLPRKPESGLPIRSEFRRGGGGVGRATL
jgi:hypothetical protein